MVSAKNMQEVAWLVGLVGDFKHVLFSISYIWVNYNELTTSSLEIMVSKGNHPKIALIQVSELL